MKSIEYPPPPTYHESGREAKVGVDLEDRVRIKRIVYAEQILRKVPVQRVLHFFLKKRKKRRDH